MSGRQPVPAPEPDVRLAVESDIPALMALEARYYIGNLDEAQRVNGFLSVKHSARWFAAAVDAGGVHVADAGGTIGGFIVVTDLPSRSEGGLPPIVRAMTRLTRTLQFNGAPIAGQRCALRGPVLIDEAMRGRGLYGRFNAAMRAAHSARFDVGVLFVAADNPRSLHTVTAKLRAEPLATFEVGDRGYHFLAFAFDAATQGAPTDSGR